MTYRAVMFDLDGTLLDTIEDLAASMNVALAELGLPPRTVAECKVFVGDGVEMYARRALGEDHQDDATVQRCIEVMRVDYVGRWHDKTRPYDGVPELVGALAERGLTLAVLSNKPDGFTREMVADMLGAEPFAVVRGALPDVPRKPDPAAALAIAHELDIPADQWLYVGDTNTDMQTAIGAGMVAVGVLWGFRDAEELNANGAAVLLDRPASLLDLL